MRRTSTISFCFVISMVLCHHKANTEAGVLTSSSSCPCSALTAVANVVGTESSTASYAFLIIEEIIGGIWPVVTVSLTFLPNAEIYLIANQVIGYLFHGFNFYFLTLIGCPSIIALSNTTDLIPETTLMQSDFLRGSAVFLTRYTDSCNIIPATTSIKAPSTPSVSRISTFQLSSLTSAFIAPRNGQSISSIESGIRRLNYAVNLESTSSGVFVQQPGHSSSNKCAAVSTKTAKYGINEGKDREKYLKEGVDVVVTVTASQLSKTNVSATVFFKLLIISSSFYSLIDADSPTSALLSACSGHYSHPRRMDTSDRFVKL